MPEARQFRRSIARFVRRGSKFCALAAAIAVAFTGQALAQLKVCNATPSRIGLAIGYQAPSGWTTEGWWNVASQSCETLLKGSVPSRFIYVHAVDYDRGGEWAGTSQMCTDEKSFAIRGTEDCTKRGHLVSGFFEVDTGDAKEWTIKLTDPEEQGGRSR